MTTADPGSRPRRGATGTSARADPQQRSADQKRTLPGEGGPGGLETVRKRYARASWGSESDASDPARHPLGPDRPDLIRTRGVGIRPPVRHLSSARGVAGPGSARVARVAGPGRRESATASRSASNRAGRWYVLGPRHASDRRPIGARASAPGSAGNRAGRRAGPATDTRRAAVPYGQSAATRNPRSAGSCTSASDRRGRCSAAPPPARTCSPGRRRKGTPRAAGSTDGPMHRR